MDYAGLYLGIQEYCAYRCVEAFEVVCAYDKYILAPMFRRPFNSVAQCPVMRDRPYLAPSFSPTHIPSTSLWPSRSMPMDI